MNFFYGLVVGVVIVLLIDYLVWKEEQKYK